MHLYLPVDLICFLSSTFLMINSLPLIDLRQNLLPELEVSRNDVSNYLYNSLTPQYAPNKHGQQGSLVGIDNDLNLQPNMDNYPSQNGPLRGNIEDVPIMAKRQQGWYNPYGKRGFDSAASFSSKEQSAFGHPEFREISVPYNSQAFPTLGQLLDGTLHQREMETSDAATNGLKPRHESAGGKNYLSSADDSAEAMRRELSLMKKQLQQIYRTIRPDVRILEDEGKAFQGAYNNMVPLSEALASMHQLESSYPMTNSDE